MATPFFPCRRRGLNPLLRHPGMIIHPPMLYLGFVSFVIPYAFAMAALITGRSDDRWIPADAPLDALGVAILSFAWFWAVAGHTMFSAGEGFGVGTRWRFAAFMPWLTGTPSYIP